MHTLLPAMRPSLRGMWAARARPALLLHCCPHRTLHHAALHRHHRLMASPFSFPLLDLPSAALLHVFSHVRELRDAVALSLACKELWALGGPARRRHVCCAACGHAVLQAAVAFASDTHRDAPHLSLPDGDSWGVDVEHMAPGCTLGEEQELDMFEMLFALRVGGAHGAGVWHVVWQSCCWAQLLPLGNGCRMFLKPADACLPHPTYQSNPPPTLTNSSTGGAGPAARGG